MLRLQRRRFAPFVAGLALFAAGCSSPSSALPDGWEPVGGRVTVKASPLDTPRLEGGKVWLRSATDPGREAVGVIDADGTFAVGSPHQTGPVAGVPAGDYLVRVEPPIDRPGEYRPAPFHPKYSKYETSGLRVTVPAGNELNLELDRAAR